MELSNVEVVRRIYGFNWAAVEGRERGLAEVLELVAPDFEYHPDPINRTLHGFAELTVFLQAIEEDFVEFRQLPEEFLEADDHVVVFGEMRGRGRASGIPFHTRFGHVWTLSDGKAVRLEGYLDPDEARLAAGLEPADAKA